MRPPENCHKDPTEAVLSFTESGHCPRLASLRGVHVRLATSLLDSVMMCFLEGLGVFSAASGESALVPRLG